MPHELKPGERDLGTREAVVARLREVLEPRQEIQEAYLFGSQARGQATPRSDIDVAVYPDMTGIDEGPYGYDAALAADLMAALGTDRVDVVRLDRAPPALYHRVVRDGIRLVSRDPQATLGRESDAIARALDFEIPLREMARLRRERLARGEFGR